MATTWKYLGVLTVMGGSALLGAAIRGGGSSPADRGEEPEPASLAAPDATAERLSQGPCHDWWDPCHGTRDWWQA